MASYPPPTPPPGPPGSPSGGLPPGGSAGFPYGSDPRYQRRMLREQVRMQRKQLRAQRDLYRAQSRGGRRGSVVGPLLIVGLGIASLLVQTGRMDAHRLAAWYGVWWPLLFIGVGVLLVAEWLLDRGLHRDAEQTFRRRSLGGGSVAILVLLGVAGIAANAFHEGAGRILAHGFNLNQDNIDEFLGEKHESDQTLVRSIPAGASLNLTNPRGDVTVSGTSEDGQMHVDLHREVYTRSDSEAASRAQQFVPQIATSAAVVSVGLPALEGSRGDLTVTVPGGTAVTINANHGDVKITAIKAAVTVLANHGDVDVSAITGSVTAHVNNGGSSFSAHSISGGVSVEGHASDLTLSEIGGPVTMNGEFFGTTHLEHISAPLRFHTSRTEFALARLDGQVDISSDDLSADRGLGPVVLTTRSHNVNLQGMAGDVTVTDRNGSVDLTSAPPMGNVTVENRNGTVKLTVPEQAGFTVDAQTTDGEVEDDFALNTREMNSRKTITGSVGGGGPMVRINTSQGDISLRKAAVAPLPPAPPKPPPISITGANGASVSIGSSGVHIAGEDGSRVEVTRDGVQIRGAGGGNAKNEAGGAIGADSGAGDAKVYAGRDGSQITKSADGSVTLVERNGTRYVSSADGSKAYAGNDGTRITVSPDGSKIGIGPGGTILTEEQIAGKLRVCEDEIRAETTRRAPVR